MYGPSGQVSDLLKCPYCRARVIVDSDENVCTSCGAVLGYTAESPIFNRVQSVWSYSPAVSNGTKAVRIGSARATVHINKNEVRTVALIDKIGTRMNLPLAVRGDAILVARRIMKDNGLRKSLTRLSISDVSVLSIYKACRNDGVSKTLKELSAACAKAGLNYPPNKIFKRANRINLALAPSTPRECIKRILSKIYGNEKAMKRLSRSTSAKGYLMLLTELGLTMSEHVSLPGRNPWLVSAAIVCTADDMITGRRGLVGREAVADAINCGRSNLSEAVANIKGAMEGLSGTTEMARIEELMAGGAGLL